MVLSVVIAPDSFKGSLASAQAAQAIAEGWASVRPGDRITLIPQADGGEGTLDTVAAAVPAAVFHSVGAVSGPDGAPVEGRWLALPGRVALIELAQTSGLPLMPHPDPLGASTRGLGQVIAAALAAGARSLVIGLGGSASTDGGAGALTTLGLRLLDAEGRELPDGGGALARLARIERAALTPPPDGGVTLLADVTAPLLGPRGAAAVFGPQKGATPRQVATLEAALGKYASLLGAGADTPGAGAAGGTGYGFIAAWRASVEPGADYLARLSGLPDAIAAADVVLSGEGRFDATSMGGKLVGRLLALAEAAGCRAGVIAGELAADTASAGGRPAWATELIRLAGSAEAAMAEPARWLRLAGADAARELGDPNVSRASRV